MRFPQPMPSEDSKAGFFARQLALLIGSAYQPVDNTRVAARLLALGGAIRDARATNLASLAEAFPDTAAQLLSDWETHLGLAVRGDLSIVPREQRALAKARAARAGTPQSMLVAVRALDPTETIYENTLGPVGDEMFVFAILIQVSTFNNPLVFDQIRAIVEQMKPAFTRGNLPTRIGFRCDDPLSLVDRDCLRI